MSEKSKIKKFAKGKFKDANFRYLLDSQKRHHHSKVPEMPQHTNNNKNNDNDNNKTNNKNITITNTKHLRIINITRTIT